MYGNTCVMIARRSMRPLFTNACVWYHVSNILRPLIPRTVSPLKMMRSARLMFTASARNAEQRRGAAVANHLQPGIDRRPAARHLEQHVDAVAVGQRFDLVDEVGLRSGEKRRVGTEPPREFEFRRIDVDREHGCRARRAGHRNRHQSDRSHARDRHAFDAHSGGHDRMDGVAERIEDRRILIRNRRVELPDVVFGHNDVLRERAVAIDPDDLERVRKCAPLPYGTKRR